MSEDAALIEARGLTVRIGRVTAASGLDLAVPAGRSLGILGPNGIGKTTLLLTLAGIRPAEAGTVLLDGAPLDGLPRRAVARRLGMLTQNTRFAFDATCLETALSGRHPHLGPWARESARDRAIALEALDRVGLAERADDSCMHLSGGEQRRLSLAVVLAQDPAVMLLDEPTNHLDPAHQVALLDRLWARVHAGRRAQVLALHDVNLATCYCTDVLMLFGDGRWEAGPTGDLLTAERLSRLYGCTIRAVSDGAQTVFAVAGGDSRA
ncbi:MAG: ABC transporter ATP-binding protein [Wenzhouxiangellaceae bacterium]|nr:ABC transporter ATP-binding protein [Wenzhouxiangellaceae bacterium]